MKEPRDLRIEARAGTRDLPTIYIPTSLLERTLDYLQEQSVTSIAIEEAP